MYYLFGHTFKQINTPILLVIDLGRSAKAVGRRTRLPLTRSGDAANGKNYDQDKIYHIDGCQHLSQYIGLECFL